MDVEIQGVGARFPSAWPITDRGWAWARETFDVEPGRGKGPKAPCVGFAAGDLATVVEAAQEAGIKLEISRIGPEEGGCS